MRVCCVLLVCISVVNCSPTRSALNYRPIIGVLAQESDLKDVHYGDTYIPSDYFKYLEMAGARAVPVFVKQPNEYYQRTFDSINGLLFPGGGVGLVKSEFAKTAKVFYTFATKANDNGDYFPLWGTCQGFELLTYLATGKNVLSDVDGWDMALPLDFEDGYRTSRLFGDVAPDVFKYLATQNTTMNFHHLGLTPETFELTSDLKNFYNVLSTNLDKNGKRFISTMEAKKYPYYGVQWHPEKANFLWNVKYHINHDYAAVRVSQYMANFFVQEARKSSHHFQTETTEIDSLIENYKPVFVKDTTFGEIYYFNYTTTGFRSIH